MVIEWEITKKRGNMRPLLQYRVQLEEHEKALALPGVSIRSSIRRPVEDWQEYCYPGQYERAETPLLGDLYLLEAPSHKGHSGKHTLKLPWREDNHYPEVNASFELLREAIEKELADAEASHPIEQGETLQTTLNTKTTIAPSVLGERLLRLASKARASSEASNMSFLPSSE